MLTQTILASGDGANWQNGNSSLHVATRCWFCLQTVAEACCIPEMDIKRMLGQPVFISRILSALDFKVSAQSWSFAIQN